MCLYSIRPILHKSLESCISRKLVVSEITLPAGRLANQLWKATKKYAARDLLLSSGLIDAQHPRRVREKFAFLIQLSSSRSRLGPLLIQSFSSAIQPIDLLTLRCVRGSAVSIKCRSYFACQVTRVGKENEKWKTTWWWYVFYRCDFCVAFCLWIEWRQLTQHSHGLVHVSVLNHRSRLFKCVYDKCIHVSNILFRIFCCFTNACCVASTHLSMYYKYKL